MLRLICIWLTLMTLLAACRPQTAASPATQIPAVSSAAATALEAPVQAGPTASPTPETPPAPVALPPMQPLALDSFGRAKLVHEFWPDVQKAAKLYRTIRFDTSVTDWEFSPDGRYVAIAGCDVEAGEDIHQFGVTRCEQTVHESSSHAWFFVFDASTGSLVTTLPETAQVLTVSDIGFTHDGKKLLYTSHPGALQIWDMATSTLETTVSQEGAQYISYQVSRDDKWLTLQFDEQPIRIWDLKKQQYATGPVSSLGGELSADGRRMLVIQPPYLIVYDTGTGRKLSQQAMLPDGFIMFYDISNDFSLMAVCDRGLDDQPVKIWDVATAALLKTLPHEFGKCGRLLFTPDGNYLLFFNNHGAGPMVWRVNGWEYAPGSHLSTNFVGATDQFVGRVQFSQDQSLMVVPTFSRLTLYSLPLGEAPAEAAEPTPRPPLAAFVEPPPISCDLKVTGAFKLEINLCDPPQAWAYEGYLKMAGPGLENDAVKIHLPDWFERNPQPGTYHIMDATDALEGTMYARLLHAVAAETLSGAYESYSGTGDLVVTEVAGSLLSGSYKFGARTDAGMEVNVEGTFKNIPYVHTGRQ